jgi:hypothetical protein
LQFLGFLLLALQNRRLFYAGLTGLLSLWVLISFMAGYPLGMDILGRLFLYLGVPISPVESKNVPEVLKTISEQGRVSFLHSYPLYFSSEFPFYIALIFLPLLFFRFFKGQLLLLPLYVLLVLSVVKGSIRVYMYSAPVLAMGFAYGAFLISRLSDFLEKRSLKLFVGGLFPPLMLMSAINWFSLIDKMPGFFISKEDSPGPPKVKGPNAQRRKNSQLVGLWLSYSLLLPEGCFSRWGNPVFHKDAPHSLRPFTRGKNRPWALFVHLRPPFQSSCLGKIKNSWAL